MKKKRTLRYGLNNNFENMSNTSHNLFYSSSNLSHFSNSFNIENTNSRDSLLSSSNGFKENINLQSDTDDITIGSSQQLNATAQVTKTLDVNLDACKHESVNGERSNPGYCLTQCGKILTQVKAHPYLYYDSSHPDMANLIKSLD